MQICTKSLLMKLKKRITINTLVVDILANYLYEMDLRHFNCYEDHVTIWDGRMRRLVDVYFVPIGEHTVEPRFDVCLLSDCPSKLSKRYTKSNM